MTTRSRVRLAIVLSVLVTPWAGWASAQSEVRDPTRPILVLNPGGHGAPVQALVFTKGGDRLLSGGMDKVVHIWDVGGESPSLDGTIRPPIWRGPRGVIYALALSPVADEKGRQVLAVGGYGVQSQNGNIALYRVPAADRGGTGDLLAQLPCGNKADAEPVGHWDTVKCLAFDPGGQFLASGSFDGTVRIWDQRSRETVAVLKGHAGMPVRALAFGRDGTTLATAGGDGDVVLWDTDPAKLREFDRQRRAARDPAARTALAVGFNRRAARFRASPRPQDTRPDDPRGASINALAFSPDGRWVVIGRENGRLARYDGADLGNERRLPTDDRRQGAVEALAFAPDSKTLAVSLLAQRLANRAERPGVGCDVEVRRMPEGDLVGPAIPRASNLVTALAFRPVGKTLAYAGGDGQAVFLKDLRDANGSPKASAGLGGSFWDVGFSRDGRAVAYSRRRDDAPDPPATTLGFDLRGRRVVELARADVARAFRKLGDLSVRPTGIDALEVVDGRGAARPLALAPTDGRWWDYRIVPPTADHPRMAVAVAVEAGVVIFAATPDGKAFRRVRFLAGHTGPVYALAPSPDGKWLLTGSSDQTLRLWPLAHRDTLAPLGATFAPAAEGRMTATAVEPRGFAEAMGLERGDVVEKLFVAGLARDPKEAATAPDAAPPEARLEFVVRRGGKALELGTTKRDGPALALFPSMDREWVLWMPQGYYDTSIIGDRKFLGWHRNGAKPGGAGGFDVETPTDYFTIDTFEAELRRPAVLDALIASADPAVALALVPAAVRDAPALVADQAPPRVEILEPALPLDRPLVVRSAALAVRVTARTDDRPDGRRALRAVRFLVDGQPQQEVNPRKPDFDAPADLALTPGLHHVNVVAIDDAGHERTRTFPVEYLPPDDFPLTSGPEPRVPRLLALTLGAEAFSPGSGLPPIPFAANDARDVGAFFRDPRAQRFGKTAEARVIHDPTSSKVQEAFARLDTERQAGRWGPGDTLIVMVESHVLVRDQRSFVPGTDAGAGEPPRNAVPASELSDALGEIASYGARVLVLIDGVHEPPDGPGRPVSHVGEWARELYRKNVIAFPASIQGPGRRLASRSHGAFAEAILGSLDARGRVRLTGTSGRPMDLDEFRDAVEMGVQRLTGLQQFARCYVPPTIPAKGTIFEPPALPTALSSRP